MELLNVIALCVFLAIVGLVALCGIICVFKANSGLNSLHKGVEVLGEAAKLLGKQSHSEEKEVPAHIPVKGDYAVCEPGPQADAARNTKFVEALLCGAYLANEAYTSELNDQGMLVRRFGQNEGWKTFEAAIPKANDVTHFFYAYKMDTSGVIARMMICVRGTKGVADSVMDIDAQTTDVAGSGLWDKAMPPFPGLQMHEGFHARAVEMMDVLVANVGTDLRFAPHSRIVVCGHSLGGAVATLVGLSLAWKFCKQFEPKPPLRRPHGARNIWVCTYGAPRCFMWTMPSDDPKAHSGEASKFEKQLHRFLSMPELDSVVKITRVKTNMDPVTSVPFATMERTMARHVTPFALVLKRDSDAKDGAAEDATTLTEQHSVVDDETEMKKEATKLGGGSLVAGIAKFMALGTNGGRHLMQEYMDRLERVYPYVPLADDSAYDWTVDMFSLDPWWYGTAMPDDIDSHAASKLERMLHRIKHIGVESFHSAAHKAAQIVPPLPLYTPHDSNSRPSTAPTGFRR